MAAVVVAQHLRLLVVVLALALTLQAVQALTELPIKVLKVAMAQQMELDLIFQVAAAVLLLVELMQPRQLAEMAEQVYLLQ
jgi:hypothetical protein